MEFHITRTTARVGQHLLHYIKMTFCHQINTYLAGIIDSKSGCVCPITPSKEHKATKPEHERSATWSATTYQHKARTQTHWINCIPKTIFSRSSRYCHMDHDNAPFVARSCKRWQYSPIVPNQSPQSVNIKATRHLLVKNCHTMGYINSIEWIHIHYPNCKIQSEIRFHRQCRDTS